MNLFLFLQCPCAKIQFLLLFFYWLLVLYLFSNFVRCYVFDFLQLAKKYHPDANKSNPASKRKFQEIRDAYEVCSFYLGIELLE